MIENLSALSGVAYKKLGAIFPNLVVPKPAARQAIIYRRLSLDFETTHPRPGFWHSFGTAKCSRVLRINPVYFQTL
jgi:hypothetical protein